jgi:diguanylate cyclase (GGDEF)-like protein
MVTDQGGSVARDLISAHDAGITRSQRAREELAKAWLLEVLERTPLREIEEVPVAWIASEAPALIGDIVRSLSDPAPSANLALPADGIERISELGELRQGESALEIPKDLAALQTLLIEALRREIPERQVGAFAGSVGRLASIFGDIQAQVSEKLVRERSGGATVDPLTGLPGPAELHEWLRIQLAEHQRHGQPFSLLLIDVEGLGRINQAHGRDAGDRMLRAVAAVLRRQIRPSDRAFRVADDEFCVLAPHQEADDAVPVAERLCELVERSQGTEGYRIAISVGLASCPEHGTEADALLAAAEEASWAAKAAGRGVGVGTP